MEIPFDSYFTKVRGLGPDKVWVCGENGCVIFYDGQKWHDVSL